MTKEQIDTLHKLSNKEKYDVVQMLWDDIAADQPHISLPPGHIKVLEERLQKYKSGETKFRSWEEIIKKYLPS